MKVLLTGANGQLGRAFQELFSSEHVDFVPVDITGTEKKLDITDFKRVRSLCGL